MPDIKELFAQRLQMARKRAGLSLRVLAERLVPAVSYQTIKHYEDGRTLPDSERLLALATALQVSVDYLFRPVTYSLGEVSFRRKASLTKAQLGQLEEDVRDRVERYLELEETLNAATPFHNPLAEAIIRNGPDVERAADHLREAWDLGINPVPNVIELLEEKGVKVLEIDGPAGFDGLATYAGDSVAIIVVNQHLTTERKRFTALHELGHLLLQFAPDTTAREQETCCHRFAGALLIAAQVVRRELGPDCRPRIDLQELVPLKEYYGISVQALMARASALCLITDHAYKSFCIAARQNKLEQGWGEYVGKEHSGRAVRLAHQAVARDLLSLSKAADLAGQPLPEFRAQMQLFG